MYSCLGRTASSCLRPLSRYARMSKDDEECLGSEDDALLWSRDLEKHSHGEFSLSVIQANEILEDQSQVETGQHATFVGIYDGHGGLDASRYICDHLYHHLLRLAQENGNISEEILRNAVYETENGFLTLVRRAYAIRPAIAAIGSCCLAGVIWKRTLYVANLGDSRAVMGNLETPNNIVAEQLTKDHNASMEEVRKELKALHPEDAHILVMKQGVWRIKGIIQARLPRYHFLPLWIHSDTHRIYIYIVIFQVSRSIGDAYLKRPEFALNSSFPRFYLSEPLRQPVLRSDPAVVTRHLQPNDKFIIFASDGLWEYLTNQEAVEIVHNNSRVGIARKLVISAMQRAGKTREISYNDIKKLEPGMRRHVHDDITVVVVFIDQEMGDDECAEAEAGAGISVRGFVDEAASSNFSF